MSDFREPLDEVTALKKIITNLGFELIAGEFIDYDRDRVPFFARPVDGRKLMRLAMQAPPFVEESS